MLACLTVSGNVVVMDDVSVIFVSESEHEMPGHLDSDLFCQQWVRLSMLWEDVVSNFHIVSGVILCLCQALNGLGGIGWKVRWGLLLSKLVDLANRVKMAIV